MSSKSLSKHFLFIVFTILFSALYACKEHKLDTKLIVSKYGKGVVKILLLDTIQEKIKEGSGYKGRGSGFFVTKDGYIFTNRHVVEMCVTGYIDYDYKDKSGKTRSNLTTYSNNIINDNNFVKAYRTGYTTPMIQVYHGSNEKDYKLYYAEVVAIGMGAFDGAILKIVSDIEGNPVQEKFKALPIGNSNETLQGEQLCVYGFPQQYQGDKNVMLLDMSTLSIGIMSGMDYVFNEDYGYIKTDAEIHGGNSGGPVFDEKNEVIGIATAVGTKTNIGLVGGINGMYYISVSNPELQDKLKDAGLVSPERSLSINTASGKKIPIKSVGEINTLVSNRNKSTTKKFNSSYTANYKNSKIFFSNISPKQNNNTLPGKSKQYSTFTFKMSTGGQIWVYIDNYPSKLNTSQIKVYIDRKLNNKYVKHKNLTYNVNYNYTNMYFPFTFYEATSYKITAYSKENKYIGTAYFTSKYQPE